MPPDLAFELPFPLRRNEGLDRARRHNLEWVRRFGLTPSEEASEWFALWDIPALAAYGFPDAPEEGLDLCADAMAFFFLLDDQFDGPLGRLPDRVAAVCRQFIDVGRGVRPPASAGPLLHAFAELWERCRRGAPASWRARAAGEWEYYFAAHAYEAVNRVRGRPTGFDEYLEVRRGIAAADLPICLGERAFRIEVPPAAFHGPQLRILRRTAIEITFMCNDIFSLEKEESRGDMDNLVLVIERNGGLSREAALARARDEIIERCALFRTLSAQVPDVCARLGFSEPQTDAVRRYVDVMAGWIRGYHEWETRTLRYTRAADVVPAHRSGYFDALLVPTEDGDA
jgi:avermitilol synthase